MRKKQAEVHMHRVDNRKFVTLAQSDYKYLSATLLVNYVYGTVNILLAKTKNTCYHSRTLSSTTCIGDVQLADSLLRVLSGDTFK